MSTSRQPCFRLHAIARQVLACAFGALSALAQAQIYAGTAEDGSLLLSNHASPSTPTLLIAAEAPPPVPVVAPPPTAAPIADRPLAPLPRSAEALGPLIRDTALRHDVSETLLTAVIAVESGFDPRAVSPKGAKGLMQLMPDTARRFGVKDVFSAHDNLQGGAAYLRRLITLFDNDLPLALAAYNAGEGAVIRAGRRVPAYPETREYVAKVLAHVARAGRTESAQRRGE